MFFSIFVPTLLELEVYRFVCDFKLSMMRAEDYLRPSEPIGSDWIVLCVAVQGEAQHARGARDEPVAVGAAARHRGVARR